MRAHTLLLLGFLATSGCGWLWSDSPDVAKVAAVAKKIEADPANVDEVLKDAGMTRKQFEADLYKIAEDAEASEAYAKALK
jgi:hypothetical protein